MLLNKILNELLKAIINLPVLNRTKSAVNNLRIFMQAANFRERN